MDYRTASMSMQMYRRNAQLPQNSHYQTQQQPLSHGNIVYQAQNIYSPSGYAPPPPPLPPPYPPVSNSCSFYPQQQPYAYPPVYQYPPPSNPVTAHTTSPRPYNPPVKAVEIYCDSCDRSFPSEQAYAAHVATHCKCNHPGCSFEGTKRVVSVHFDLAHGAFSGTGYKEIDVEGQRFRVLMGTEAAEVEEWRNERRRRFPTSAAVQQKSEAKRLLSEAGGLSVQTESTDKAKRRRLGQTAHVPAATAAVTNAMVATAPAEQADSAPADFSAGGLGLLQGYGSDDEVEDAAVAIPPVQETQPINGPSTGQTATAACRMHQMGKCKRGDKCRYNHDSSATVAEPPSCAYFSQGKCRRGSRCLFAHSGEPQRQTLQKNKKKSAAPGGLTLPPVLDGSGQHGSLYRKLAEREVDVEENVLLQCLRYLVQNKDAFVGVDRQECSEMSDQKATESGC